MLAEPVPIPVPKPAPIPRPAPKTRPAPEMLEDIVVEEPKKIELKKNAPVDDEMI